MLLELVPEYDRAKSFYGKALVRIDADNGVMELTSYTTVIARYWPVTGAVAVYSAGIETATSLRHVKEWLRQLGLYAGTKAEIKRNYLVTE